MPKRVRKLDEGKDTLRVPTKQLLDLVFKYSEVYNKTHPFYNDPGHMDYVWKSIAKQLNCSAKRCKTHWNLTRGKFFTFYRTTTLISGQRHHLHEDMMRFLPFYRESAMHPSKTNADNVTSTTNRFSPINSENDPGVINGLVIPEKDMTIEEVRLANDPPRSERYLSLIELIHHHSELYDQSHPLYYDMSHSKYIWNVIATQLNETENQCRAWWNTILGKFFSFYSNITIPTGRKHGLHKEMVIFLPFFPDYYTNKSQKDPAPSHIRFDSPENEELSPSPLKEAQPLVQGSSEIQYVSSQLDIQEQVQPPEPPTSSFPSDNFKIKLEKPKAQNNSNVHEVSDVVRVKEETFANNSIVTITIDDDDDLEMESISEAGSSVQSLTVRDEQSERASKAAREELIDSFFNAVSASVKNLTPLRQNQAKMRIFEIISGLELEQLQK